MVATSKVKICNLALIALGAEPIMSLDENNEQAKNCKLLWDQNLKYVLNSFPWNCARAQVLLPALSDSPLYGYSYSYQLPTNPWCLNVISVGTDPTNQPDWRIVGRTIECDEESPLYIEYTKLITDYNQMEPLLIEAVAARLASEMAIRIAKSPKLRKEQLEIFMMKLGEARVEDARTGTTSVTDTDTWLTIRD